jgi:hypothetical protein
MRYDRTSTDRSDNFERRLKKTMDSELDPEMITPMTAGCEELDYTEIFPLVEDFHETNMKPHMRVPRITESQRGKDQD